MVRRRKAFRRTRSWKKSYLTGSEARLLSTMGIYARKQREKRHRKRTRRISRPMERSELVVIPGLSEKFKALKKARKKEIESMRDR